MTVNLSQKDYIQLLKATNGHPDQVFQPSTEIMHEGGIMAHKADCTIHAGIRCDCHPELEHTNEFLVPLIFGINAVT